MIELVQESGTKSNPGAEELNVTLSSVGSSIPYYAVLDASGRRVGDAFEWTLNGREQHSGDLAWFLTLVRRTSPRVDRALMDAAAREAGVTPR